MVGTATLLYRLAPAEQRGWLITLREIRTLPAVRP